MPSPESILLLLALVVLVGFLMCRQWGRSRRRRLERSRRVRPEVHPIDVTPLRPRLCALRRDFSAAVRDHTRPVHARAGTLARARCRLVSLGFFRRQPCAPETERLAH